MLDSYRFRGRLTGYPLPEIVLFKGGVEVAENDRIHSRLKVNGEVELEIRRCELEDDDEYTLQVENLTGMHSCQFELFVECAGS